METQHFGVLAMPFLLYIIIWPTFWTFMSSLMDRDSLSKSSLAEEASVRCALAADARTARLGAAWPTNGPRRRYV